MRDKRLLGAMLCLVASALAWLIQVGITRAYIDAAVLGEWDEFVRFHGVKPPAEPGTICLDHCAAGYPFLAGWAGIALFFAAFLLVLRSWLKPLQ